MCNNVQQCGIVTSGKVQRNAGRKTGIRKKNERLTESEVPTMFPTAYVTLLYSEVLSAEFIIKGRNFQNNTHEIVLLQN